MAAPTRLIIPVDVDFRELFTPGCSSACTPASLVTIAVVPVLLAVVYRCHYPVEHPCRCSPPSPSLRPAPPSASVPSPSVSASRIKAGILTAVKVGRAYRVHVDSVNALLGAPAAAPQTPTPAPHPPTPSVPPASPKPGRPQPGTLAWVEQHMALCDASDAPCIAEYTARLESSDPEVIRQARYQLSMFQRAREQRLRELMASIPPSKPTPRSEMIEFL